MTTVKILIVVNIFDRYNKKNKWAEIFPDHDITELGNEFFGYLGGATSKSPIVNQIDICESVPSGVLSGNMLTFNT